MKERIVILLPVYNDWVALELLFENMLVELSSNYNCTVLVVNDGSDEKMPDSLRNHANLLNLSHNVGHQKAIAIGLSYLYNHLKCTKVLVMDADGNDLPSDAIKLLKESTIQPGKIIVGRRARRTDGWIINLFYKLYLLTFKVLTGKYLRFGNFCVIPFTQVYKLINRSEIWLHLPAGIVKSRLPFQEVETHKGKRLQGLSKMNFAALLYHGLGAISVFIDLIALRLLMFSGTAIIISFLSLITIVYIRFFTDLGIPGWASTVGISIVIIILLSFLISLLLIFIFIISQSFQKFIPAIHYKDYLQKNLLEEEPIHADEK